ncbi:MAG: NTP transferase domain-containing protein [SAR324 cluster bacterium]|nr:NTP transferase domain-containing protein [SAR324 cluster bacterium]MDP7331767.1 NTP transferase domain-containing protein [SAR324 cluster bacterium]MDP7498176.1 NTP transferase domain-containing protein [SAR324 cluster bacterium]
MVPLLGVPLIERVIRSSKEGGADEFFVVTGQHQQPLSDFLKPLAERISLSLTLIQNDEWEQGNGVSVLKARDWIDEPFLLMMADHLVDQEIIQALSKQPLVDGEVILAVDTNLQNPMVDLEDVTRVHVESGRILDIDKSMAEYNAFDTGCFLCTPTIFDALEEARDRHNDTSLSAGIRVLAKKQKIRALPVRNFWIDVDDQKSFEKAEQELLQILRGKSHDGPVSRRLNRPLSIRCSRILVRYPVTPNQISLFSFLLSVLATVLFVLDGYAFLVLGGVVAQASSIIDGCDGEVARLKYLSSEYGGWFDAVLDRYADAFLLFGLTWHVHGHNPSPLVLVVGFLAIIGSFMVSYTADKHDRLMKSRIDKGIRIGRDIRVFLIFCAALLNMPYLILMAIAVLMNTEAIRRIIVCREHEES